MSPSAAKPKATEARLEEIKRAAAAAAVNAPGTKSIHPQIQGRDS